jgi:hypothetical protein
MECPKNSNEICGGGGANSIYTTGPCPSKYNLSLLICDRDRALEIFIITTFLLSFQRPKDNFNCDLKFKINFILSQERILLLKGNHFTSDGFSFYNRRKISQNI